MEQQKLPNSTLVLVLGILSILTCCCWGVIGLILGIVALVMAKKATALYLESPENYSGYQNVKTGKILAYVGIVLSVIYLCYTIYIYAVLGQEGIMDMQNQILEQMGQ